MKTKVLSIEDVLDVLQSIQVFEPGLSDNFKKLIKSKKVKKGSYLLSPPSVCRNLYFIKEGLLRSYYLKGDGAEVTSGLYIEGDFVVAVSSFYMQAPSVEYIHAVENTEVFYISYQELQGIYKRYPDFRLNGLSLTIRYLVDYSLQMQLIRAMSGAEKLSALRERYPKLLTRVPQKYLASYVDLIPETFSKLKRKFI